VSCSPVRPCDDDPRGIGIVPPPAGAPVLPRRSGDYWRFLDDLTATVEQLEVDGAPLGARWDVEGDPHGSMVAGLWAAVAEGVAAQAELTAGESYVGTARDWTDLRRIAALVGYRPRPRIAAQGWVVTDVDRGTDPLVPAGTRVQAPATPARPVQTFEAAADTQLHAEWAGLTATWVPVPARPGRRELRFLGAPGFRAGDDLLFVREVPQSPAPVGYGWFPFWTWILSLFLQPPSAATALSIAGVVGSAEELGTSLVSFDRDLDGVLDSLTDPYAAYRIVATAAPAKRLTRVLRIPSSGSVEVLPLGGSEPIVGDTSVILDSALENLSAGQLVAVVDWQTKACDVARVRVHEPVIWETAPGTPRRASKLTFDRPMPALTGTGREKSIYVLDRRIVARHYEFPESRPAGPARLRLYPRPTAGPDRVAVDTGPPERPAWEVFECRASAEQEDPGAGGDAPSGMIVDLLEGSPGTGPLHARASGNLIRVRHGETKQATIGSGNAAAAFQRLKTPDAPIAYDVDDAGNPVPTLVLRVDGVRWDERPSLYGAGPAPAFAVRLEPDGAVIAEFGDGTRGARLPTGRNNVAATYRVGGGSAGEVESGAIENLVGSVRGVKKVRGAGPTSGGADQDSEQRLRRLAPTRARAFGRAVSIEDLVDLSLAYPGVSHAAAWNGAGPPGCACGGSGLHIAFVRAAAGGPRPPVSAEIRSLSSFLDSRRDATVPLCVAAGTVTRPPISAILAVEPRREPGAVASAAVAALTDPDGPLAPDNRQLGQALDRSDVLAALHAVTGVVGVEQLAIAGATGELGRLAAARYELVYPPPDPAVTGQPA
jgi:hypothetical protein